MSDYLKRLSQVRRNPGLMQDVCLNELERQLQGLGDYDVPDASNPFVYMMEASTFNATMVLNEMEGLMRRLYPRMAATEEELYLHMSDVDYIGRFASPAWTTFELYLSREEVLARAVPTGIQGMRKLVIPRHTRFMVADIPFTMQYPIEIRVLGHGGLQIVYDTSVVSPIQSLDTNMVEWDVVQFPDGEMLLLKIPAGQFRIITHHETLNSASGFNANYSFTDSFYYARVYLSGPNNTWREITTTHTDQVYDYHTATAVLKVTNQVLNVKLPPIYFTSGIATGEIRVDVYTTRGRLEIDPGSYPAGQFSRELIGIDDNPTFVSPLESFNRFSVLNPNYIAGGAPAVPFETLREQVLTNALGSSQIPITSAQLTTEMQARGFNIVKNVDNITRRQFLATRRLLPPASDTTRGGIGSMMGQFQTTIEAIAGSDYVIDNGDRITITPGMLYRYTDGVIRTVLDSEVQTLLAMPVETRIRAVNTARYLFSPFHYVLDTTNNRFDVRPYYMDSPEVVRKQFVGENSTSLHQITASEYDLTRITGGYRLTIRTTSSDSIKELDEEAVVAQLGYRPAGEYSYASLNGVLVEIDEDNERVFQFDILTRFDVNANDELTTTNFTMFDDVQNNFACLLTDMFDVSFVVVDRMQVNYVPGELDALVQTHLLPPTFMVVSRERFQLRLGYALTNLWRRHRSIVTEQSYRRYPEDVPYVYQENVYRRDHNGQIVILPDGFGGIVYDIVHHAGDPVLDENGDVKYQHLAGDVILDEAGEPELIAPRKILREFMLFLLDGCYYFATEPQSVEFRQSVPLQIVRWIANDVGQIHRRLLEQSELYLYPTATMGDAAVIVRSDIRMTITLEQSLIVTYNMPDTTYTNYNIREALMTSTRTILNEMLNRRTVSTSDIVARLAANAGDDIVSVEVEGLGGDNHGVVTIVDDSMRLSFRKRLTLLSNQYIAVQDSLGINFLRHNPVE